MTAGADVVLDVTPRFAAPGCVGRGCPCNAEKFNCVASEECAKTVENSRPCEDPRGAVWSTNHPESSGGQSFEFFKLRKVRKGTWWAKACPPVDYTDALGFAVPVQGDGCSLKTVVGR